jgi:pimeloyl-ACP methyl ester carboxylesterase
LSGAQGRTAGSTRRGHAEIGDVSLYYEIHGGGPPLVMIHGWTLNARMWDDQVEALAGRYTVVRYDRRGFGRSSGEPATERDVDDLDRLLAFLAIPRAAVLGMSQGGWAALYFALDHPDRTDALILQAAMLPGLNLPFTGPDRVPSDVYVELARTEGMSAMRRAWIDHPFFTVARTIPGVASRLAAMVEEYSGADLAKIKTPVYGDARDAVHRASRIEAPTLVLIGACDIPYMRLLAGAQAYLIPRATLVELPGCGHLANMEAPAAFNVAVERFLDGVTGRRAGTAPRA